MKPRKKTRKDGSTYWLARWYDREASTPVKKVIRSKAFRTKDEALKYQAKVATEQATGTYVDPTLGKVTLASWWAQYEDQMGPGLKPSTLAEYGSRMRTHILPHLGQKQLASIKRLTVTGWVGKLNQNGTSPATIRAAHRVLRTVLGAARQAGIIGTNPAEGIGTPKAPREEQHPLTPAELQAAAEATEPRYRAMVLLMGWGGLRIGEATALRAEHLNLPQGRVQVLDAYSEVGGRLILGRTKNNRGRVVTLPSSVTQALRDHLDTYPPGPYGLVFTAKEGGPIRRTNFYHRAWIPALKAAGIGHRRIHDLRHTAVSLAIQVGAHPKEIQARAGHSSINVTMDTYGHLFPGQDENLAARLDQLAVGPGVASGDGVGPELVLVQEKTDVRPSEKARKGA